MLFVRLESYGDMGLKQSGLFLLMPCTIGVFVYATFNFIYSNVSLTKDASAVSSLVEASFYDRFKASILPHREIQRREILVIGILSRTGNTCKRNAQRDTFVNKARTYEKLDVRIFFILDEETPELSEEQDVHGDIVFLNTSIHGYSRQFGRKLYVWLQHVMNHFPDASMIGRMDDDAFVCVPQILDRLYDVNHEMLYYGFGHKGIDDMFMIIGRTLAKKVLSRRLCTEKKEQMDCLWISELATGSQEFRRWVKPYKDIHLVNEMINNRMLWYYGGRPEGEKRLYLLFRTWDFCKKFLLFHKASVTDIYRMHIQNEKQRKFGYTEDINDIAIELPLNCTTN